MATTLDEKLVLPERVQHERLADGTTLGANLREGQGGLSTFIPEHIPEG